MDLHADARIPFPREVVFAVFRDELDQLVPYLPSVRSIEITAREERGVVVENVIEWHVGANIPRPLRAVISESMMSWTDYATWDADTLTCDWHTETHAFVGAVRCGAHDRFLEDGPGKTLLEIRGALEVDGTKIRGVPALLAPRVGRTMESFLVDKIRSDLVKTTEGLAKYLEQRRSGAPIA
jgi:hypothetical protein